MTASLTLSRTQATVGDPVAVTVTIEAPSSSTIRWTSPASSEQLTRQSAGPWRFEQHGDTWKATRREIWAAFQPGMEARLPYELRIERDGRLVHEGRLVSPALKIVSVIPRGEKDPRLAPLEVPRSRLYIPWPAVAAAAMLLAAAILFAVFLRRRKGLAAAASPHEVYERELARLDERLASGEPDEEFYDRLAVATRRYLEEVLEFPARRETSSEIARTLRSDPRGLPATEIDFTLLACDEYRFARREIRRERARQAVESGRRAGELIRQILAPPPAAEEPPVPERRSA